MINFDDFNTVMMAAQENVESMRKITATVQKESADIMEERFQNVRRDMVQMSQMFKKIGVMGRNKMYFSFPINGKLESIAFPRELNDGIIGIGPNQIRFDMKHYSDHSRYMPPMLGSGKGAKSIATKMMDYLINNWEDISEDFVDAFKDAMTAYMAETIRIEKENYKYAQRNLINLKGGE